MTKKKLVTISAEDSDVWENDKFKIPNSFVEIVAFDSGYTILKFKDKLLSEKFKNYFGEEAIQLQKVK